ncbi:hypothetical protein [uncultured Sphaerochaeta sp.]|uniref:hypothetical protein n=1 Tax=uncultured Sphaerochaeta sp. TaxID=886478 RepID=UPI0029C9D03D|nr:hypothetical protein [uncultured Sphaerochaeta sp.]
MLKRIMNFAGGAGSIAETAQLTSFSPDTLIFEVAGLPVFPVDAEGVVNPSGAIMESDLGKLKVNAYLKNELGDDIQLINNVPLAFLLMLSDYQGASAVTSTYEIEGKEVAGMFADGKHFALPLGDIVLQGDDILTISITGTVKSADWNIKVWAGDEVTLAQELLLTYQYVKGLDSQSFSFRNSHEVYSYGITDSESTIHDYFGTEPIDYAGQIAKALCDGRYEHVGSNAKVPFAKIWNDFTNWAQDISFTTISDMYYLVVGRAFAPERSVRVTKDIRNVSAFRSAIIADDKDKAKALGFVR